MGKQRVNLEHCKFLICLNHGAIGDLVVESVIANELKACYPCCKTACLINQGMSPLLNGNPFTDQIIEVAKDSSCLEIAKTIKSINPDIILLPVPSSKIAWAAFLASVPIRVGARGKLYSRLFTHLAPDPNRLENIGLHKLDIVLNILRPLDITPKRFMPKILISEPKLEQANEILATFGISGSEKICGMHIGRGLNISDTSWPVEVFAKTANIQIEQYGYRVILTGGSNESSVKSKMQSLMANKACNITGHTNLDELIAVISRCTIFICPDTGPAHIAAALGIPVVSIFLGCDFPHLWHPLGAPNLVVTSKMPRCSNCNKDTCTYFKCLLEIEPGEIVDAVQRLAVN
jgi:lipopolysaccharide heptosyltransferase II